MRDSIFFKASTSDVNMTAPIKRETNIQTSQKSFDKRPLFKIKTSRSNHDDQKTQQPKPIGIIGNAQLISFSYPYLTITKCA
jgi:hypothetical protein